MSAIFIKIGVKIKTFFENLKVFGLRNISNNIFFFKIYENFKKCLDSLHFPKISIWKACNFFIDRWKSIYFILFAFVIDSKQLKKKSRFEKRDGNCNNDARTWDIDVGYILFSLFFSH